MNLRLSFDLIMIEQAIIYFGKMVSFVTDLFYLIIQNISQSADEICFTFFIIVGTFSDLCWLNVKEAGNNIFDKRSVYLGFFFFGRHISMDDQRFIKLKQKIGRDFLKRTASSERGAESPAREKEPLLR